MSKAWAKSIDMASLTKDERKELQTSDEFFKYLYANKFVGTDASLEESLHVYGMVATSGKSKKSKDDVIIRIVQNIPSEYSDGDSSIKYAVSVEYPKEIADDYLIWKYDIQFYTCITDDQFDEMIRSIIKNDDAWTAVVAMDDMTRIVDVYTIHYFEYDNYSEVIEAVENLKKEIDLNV